MSQSHLSGIHGIIEADELIVGEGAYVAEGVHIRGQYPGENARRVVIGENAYIGEGTKIYCPEFRIGDYSRWYENGLANGAKALQIGRNCWIGRGVNLNPAGGLILDDGVMVGEGSQLWTHIAGGDVVQGCRFSSAKPMVVGKDAWFVGHCLVGPVDVGRRSMALLGSVVTHTMLPDRVYGGSPATDLTDKVGGPQFRDVSTDAKLYALKSFVVDFLELHPEHQGCKFYFSNGDPDMQDASRDGVTCFDVDTREYTRTRSDAEVAFLKWLSWRGKFTPYGEPPFVELPGAIPTLLPSPVSPHATAWAREAGRT